MDENTSTRIKIVLIGDSTVGKTSLLTRYVKRTFIHSHVPTAFDDFYTDIDDGRLRYKAHLSDTAGVKDYDRLRPLQYPGTDVFLVCFATNDRASYKSITDRWHGQLQHFMPDVPLILVGTKSDLQAKVSTKDALKLKKRIKAKFYLECSSKQGLGIKDVFEAALTAYEENKPPKRRKLCHCILL